MEGFVKPSPRSCRAQGDLCCSLGGHGADGNKKYLLKGREKFNEQKPERLGKGSVDGIHSGNCNSKLKQEQQH